MVETKYKDHRNYLHVNKERPGTVEWIGIVLVITGVGLALLTVAQKIAMGYYAVGLVLVGIVSVLMFHRLPQKEEE
jgi:hypothetical protein